MRLLRGKPKPKREGARVIYTTKGDVAGVGFKEFTKNQAFYDAKAELAITNPDRLEEQRAIAVMRGKDAMLGIADQATQEAREKDAINEAEGASRDARTTLL